MKLDPHINEVRKLLVLGVPQTRIAAKYKCHAITVHRFVKRHDLKPKGLLY